MKVLVADLFENVGLEGLQRLGCEVHYHPKGKDEVAFVNLLREIQPEVLVVRSSKVTSSMLEVGSVKLVIRAGAGYNTIDVKAASQRGIFVSNCPGKNSIAVAELAFGLILALDRRIPDNVTTFRGGKWNKREFSKAKGLYGRKLGLIGLGRIGLEMVTRAKGFGMKVMAWSRSLTPERAFELGIEFARSPIEVGQLSDGVSVHLSLTDETRRILGRDFFSSMKQEAFLINTSRGEVIDEVALLDAIKTRGIRVGLDVFESEPSEGVAEFRSPLTSEKSLYVTHHIGASTEQAQEAIAAEVVRIVEIFKTSGKVPHAVNLAKKTPATHMLQVRHRDRPGVLACVLDAIRIVNINIQEMENVVFEGAEAAIARIHLDQILTQELLDRIRKKNSDILELSLIELSKANEKNLVG